MLVNHVSPQFGWWCARAFRVLVRTHVHPQPPQGRNQAKLLQLLNDRRKEPQQVVLQQHGNLLLRRRRGARSSTEKMRYLMAVRMSLMCAPYPRSWTHQAASMSASFHFLQSTLANVPISQVQSVSDYAHPSPVSSIHRRDDDSDESEDGEGLAREEEADNARRDLGLGGDEEEEADEEEADEEEADEEEAAEGANADCLARMGAGAAGAGAGAARAAGVAREMAVAARAPRGSGPNRSPCQHQAMDGQGRRAHQWDCVGLQQVQGQSLWGLLWGFWPCKGMPHGSEGGCLKVSMSIHGCIVISGKIFKTG
jgi:hypothetical protein